MKQNRSALDERQKQISYKAMAISGLFAAGCLAAATVYRIVTSGTLGWEFWVLLGMCMVLLISRQLLGDVERPTNLFGKPLPVGGSKKDRAARKRDYALQSAVLGFVCAGLESLFFAFGKDSADAELTHALFPNLGTGATIAVTAAFSFGSMFLISYIAEYWVVEKFKVNRYNQMLTELETDE